MTFADGSVSGNAGCNNFNGSVTVDGDSLTFGPLASTMMACTKDALTQQETDFLAALKNTASFSARGDTVTLLAEDGTITVTLARSS
ncbi:MAG: META domain-containing protein [Ilumatobacteraceae bacterium]